MLYACNKDNKKISELYFKKCVGTYYLYISICG